jgi:hypothetical protein
MITVFIIWGALGYPAAFVSEKNVGWVSASGSFTIQPSTHRL